MKEYIALKDLEVYQISRELSDLGWKAYEALDWHDKKIMGDQFIESTDSVGANIAEGYKRYHYLEKIKFYYNARASLCESSVHWSELLLERDKISKEDFNKIKELSKKLEIKLSNFIKTTYNSKNL